MFAHPLFAKFATNAAVDLFGGNIEKLVLNERTGVFGIIGYDISSAVLSSKTMVTTSSSSSLEIAKGCVKTLLLCSALNGNRPSRH